MYRIRSYKEKDLKDCTKCFYEGFFESKAEERDWLLLKDYTQVMLEKSNFNLVAEKDGMVVGFVSGIYNKSFNKKLAKTYEQKQHYGAFIKLSLKFYLKRYNTSPDFKKEFELFFQKMMEREPSTFGYCDCELAALSSRKDYRKGLGTALVNGMVEKCTHEKVKNIRLFTNTDASYKFYDKYGLTKIYEKPYSFDERQGKSMIYELLL
ncbi:N-acetylglutamate synthase-like GNAT family acetyltransferase [Aequitasia blattaphilus]|uniref:GNAT family N-acetyltransferase n=1 Tax=Aequitasia blattaphilus TaxID=2949332 RepID=A0ABT1E729_9FIRM|nr:GNAT family N-acetyltransferase [Aequitasia blattaphilus]MCP1101640.1 GNAT family N-acetyltransferase [Aequitasia blattaphilus]MCR8614280.1 GNAT family N-acetyltransferase [Aequitasia blattaphilus]